MSALAPQFWRYIPALAFTSTPLWVLFGQWVGEQMNRLSYFDDETMWKMAIPPLVVAVWAILQAARLGRGSTIILTCAALAAAWLAFISPGQVSTGALVLTAGAYAIWIFCMLAISADAFENMRWVRWIALPLLTLGAIFCAAWLGHDLILIYGPRIIDSATAG